MPNGQTDRAGPVATPPDPLVPLSIVVQHIRLADFAGRVLLALNVLLCGYVCYFVLAVLPTHRNALSLAIAPPAALARILLDKAPPLALVGGNVGLGAGLILLEAIGRSRRTKIAANAAALVLLLAAVLLFEAAIRPVPLYIQFPTTLPCWPT